MDLFMQGLVLMVIGMATVFAFLVLLIVAMKASAQFFSKYFKEEQKAVVKSASAADPMVEVAVALAAIKAKRG